MSAFITLEETLVGILQEIQDLRDLNKLTCVVRIVQTVPLVGDIDPLEKEYRAALDRIGRTHDPDLDISEALRNHRAAADRLKRRKPPGEFFLSPSVI